MRSGQHLLVPCFAECRYSFPRDRGIDRERLPRLCKCVKPLPFDRRLLALLASEDIKVIRTPFQAPNANAHMERWVGTVRRECLDRLLILSRRQLEHVLHVYVQHYNGGRPHRALDLTPPDSRARSPIEADSPSALQVNRRVLLGGLIHEYELAAA